MASSYSTIVLVATLFVLAASISATEYIVGDQSGWTLDYDYQTWAKDKVFYVGDTLAFNYASGSHNVVKVNGTGFQQCTATSSNGTLTSGRDVIALQTPGRKWYICGVAKHCELRNMKLVITVLPQMAPAPSPSASSTLALPTIYGMVVALFGGLALLFG
ncbi:basic blue protein-like protein [Tanacetum coccineum]|uniref:Basic blue protein-like protein n=1 Tax=Tanacetum coccineum TaxID=301880 RepID=A0ABQ4WUR8_9ASTR